MRRVTQYESDQVKRSHHAQGTYCLHKRGPRGCPACAGSRRLLRIEWCVTGLRRHGAVTWGRGGRRLVLTKEHVQIDLHLLCAMGTRHSRTENVLLELNQLLAMRTGKSNH